MARTSAMADIDQYISDAKQAAPPPVAIDTNAASDAVMAPVIQDTSGVTVQQEPAVPQDIEEERQSIKDMRAAQVEAARQRAEESEAIRKAREAVEAGSDAVASGKQIVKDTALRAGNAIGGVPIPGDLILPLSVLLIFFFILIVVNGHSRLMWLWLTLTGNASLTTGAGASFANTPTVGQLPPLSIGQIIPSLGQITPLPTTGLMPLPSLPSLPPVSGIFGGLAAFGTFAEEIL